MSRTTANGLVRFLENRAGEYLRGVLHYSAADHEVLYVRDDVAERSSDADREALSDYYRQKERDRKRDEPFDLGTNHCTVDFYDEAIVFHFAQGDDVGTVVTLDPEAGQDIVTFLTNCLGHLHENSPQDVDPPEWL